MKRALLVILVLSLILTSLLTLPVASAEPSVPYDLANAYVAAHPRRDVLSGGEAAAARTLASRLASRGYVVTAPSDRVTVETTDLKTVTYDVSHVIGFKDNGKGRTLLVGCFYGGYEPKDSIGTGEGARIALSVGLLLYVADALVDLPLDYDLAIAFWGGAELGSDIDLDKCGVDLSRLALYVNFDCVAAGSEDYLYADDLPRSQERYFREIAAEQGATFAEAPLYKTPAAFSTASEIYSSLHLGILGANRSFMGADVPCVSFVGGAWDY
ncbi:MAG: M28 family peptidase, partial [Clostridia bacterium]|nr:M28 family peptidase [Clostridia bacterium]